MEKTDIKCTKYNPVVLVNLSERQGGDQINDLVFDLFISTKNPSQLRTVRHRYCPWVRNAFNARHAPLTYC